ncbi:unnamed protein product [Didymodactylos carnosus]|uniref:Major facilitator superfamily (MFS) profile domain-containing protein n=1 Tax=Didymodactylos carnosus TaxID=1234261 RepID=A0A8S2GJN6_9BILA|nr:unnamed protein product [Didymodactylos carnosus]CAF3527612.1 unnamed protein product [Didymodactylos carnosus]
MSICLIEMSINLQVYIIGSFAAIGGFLFGYDTGVISGILVMKDFLNYFGGTKAVTNGNLESSVDGAIVGVLIAGCFFGALVSGPSGDHYGRKYSIVISCIVFIIGAIIQTASVNLTMLLVSRFVSGIAVGALSMLIPVYQSEIAPKEIRGRLISLQQLAITIGIAVSFWINYEIVLSGSNNLSWRLPLALQIVPALILGIGIIFFPFSPRWLLDHNRDREAIQVLARIRTVYRDEQDPRVLQEYEEIKHEIKMEREQSVRSYIDLLRYPLRRRLLLGVFVQIFQQLTGINSVMYFAPTIFRQAGLGSTASTLLATGINGTVIILATIPAVLFIDKLGRRLTMISGACVMSLSMLIIGGVMGSYGTKLANVGVAIRGDGARYTIIIFVYVFVSGFAYSWGPCGWIYPTEIFPLQMRSKGTSLTTAANWAANCAVSFIVPLLIPTIWYGTYLIFGIFCIIMAVSVFLFYPETKNRKLEEMDDLFQGPIIVILPTKNNQLRYKF